MEDLFWAVLSAIYGSVEGGGSDGNYSGSVDGGGTKGN
jgi:hypothetical protein